MPLQLIPPPKWKPSNQEYHGRTDRWSSSMLKTFRESPALAQGRYITGRFEKDPPGPSMILGSCVNLWLLEPERAKIEIMVAPCDGRGAKAFKEMNAANPDRFVITEKERDNARAIARAIESPLSPAAQLARELLTRRDGYSEYAIEWDEVVERSELNGDTVIKAKCMMDRVIEVGPRVAEVEMKTTLDPSPEGFQRQFYNLEYHCQRAFNRRGIMAAMRPEDRPLHIVVAIRNEEPYDVGVYQVAEEFIELGNVTTDDTLRNLARCYRTGNWWADFESLESTEGTLPLLAPPRYAMRAAHHTQIIDG